MQFADALEQVVSKHPTYRSRCNADEEFRLFRLNDYDDYGIYIDIELSDYGIYIDIKELQASINDLVEASRSWLRDIRLYQK